MLQPVISRLLLSTLTVSEIIPDLLYILCLFLVMNTVQLDNKYMCVIFM